MTTRTASTNPFAPNRRSHLAVARDLIVVGLCALVVAGFLFDVAGGARDPRPAAAASATLSS